MRHEGFGALPVRLGPASFSLPRNHGPGLPTPDPSPSRGPAVPGPRPGQDELPGLRSAASHHPLAAGWAPPEHGAPRRSPPPP